ncbi:hypothetical protein [Xylophilus sp.]|uniref:hypothetical protein n=1 Tax=Xylophilus sp. TaxID=2653893 RepID=UPI002D7E6D5E|nr:hypothetical protein [Xylophilus sp.]
MPRAEVSVWSMKTKKPENPGTAPRQRAQKYTPKKKERSEPALSVVNPDYSAAAHLLSPSIDAHRPAQPAPIATRTAFFNIRRA